MQRLTPTERKLSLGLAGLLFVLVNCVGWQWLWQTRAQNIATVETLRSQRDADQVWLGEKNLWAERREWLDHHQPHWPKEGDAHASLQSELSKAAQQHHLAIVDQSFIESPDNPYYREAALKFRVSGKLEDVVGWLHEIQGPELFRVVRHLSLKIDADPTMVRCDTEVAALYQKGGAP